MVCFVSKKLYVELLHPSLICATEKLVEVRDEKEQIFIISALKLFIEILQLSINSPKFQ
jgi:hypothetical protein